MAVTINDTVYKIKVGAGVIAGGEVMMTRAPPHAPRTHALQITRATRLAGVMAQLGSNLIFLLYFARRLSAQASAVPASQPPRPSC